MMNANEWAVAISKLEGSKIECDIGQIKEVLRCAVDILKDMNVVSYRGASILYIPKWTAPKKPKSKRK